MGVYIYTEAPGNLFDETIINQSTTGASGVIASKNGTIIRPSFTFGGGNGNYQITTENGFDVISSGTGEHGNCHIGMSQNTYNSIIGNNTQIIVVYDYFNLGAQPTDVYQTTISWGNTDYVRTDRSGITLGSAFSGITFAYSTPYSMVQTINTSNLSTTAVIKNLNTNQTQTATYTKSFWKETNSSYIINGGGPIWVSIIHDAYGGPVTVGNFHIYTL